MSAEYEIPSGAARRAGEIPPGAARRIDESEFLSHINTTINQKMWDEGIRELEDRDFRSIIQPELRKFMWTRAVDAMEWALMCAMGEMPFDQTKEEEIPLLCRYYNQCLTPSDWTEQEHTFMTVLNKFCELKARGYGNFAQSGGSSAAMDP